MIRGVDHINIVVGDIERSVAFYAGLLGLEVTRRARLSGDWIEAVVGLKGVEAEVVFVQPRDGGPRIELIQYFTPAGSSPPENRLANTRGLRHIALRVENLDDAHARLVAAGVPFQGPPVAVPGDVVRHDAGRKRLCYFHDPDGVLLELTEYT